MGPVAATTYPGIRVTPPHQRAKRAPDYGRRERGYVYGALVPATGDVFTESYAGRTTVGWVDFLTRVDDWLPGSCQRVFALLDNLSTHHAELVTLFALAHPRWEFNFLPTASPYLNLIEPWWKVLRSLALKGKRFETWNDIVVAVRAATAYWNDHKHPFRWGQRRKTSRRSVTNPRTPGIRLPN